MIIKILLIAGIVGAVVVALRSSRSAAYLAVRRVALIVSASIAAFSVLVPQTLTRLANAVGVGRGTDLVVYGLAVAFLFVSIGLYQRVQHLEERLIELTRSIALRDGRGDSDDK